MLLDPETGAYKISGGGNGAIQVKTLLFALLFIAMATYFPVFLIGMAEFTLLSAMLVSAIQLSGAVSMLIGHWIAKGDKGSPLAGSFCSVGFGLMITSVDVAAVLSTVSKPIAVAAILLNTLTMFIASFSSCMSE